MGDSGGVGPSLLRLEDLRAGVPDGGLLEVPDVLDVERTTGGRSPLALDPEREVLLAWEELVLLM